MKKSLLLLLFALFLSKTHAQTEIKLSPFPLLFGVAAVSLEHGLSESWGLDADLIAGQGAFGGNLSGKYYFNPKTSIDRFHIGVFTGNLGGEQTFGIGFLAGYKVVSAKNILFEIGLGAGRSFNGESILGYGKLHIGYRFIQGKSKTEPGK